MNFFQYVIDALSLGGLYAIAALGIGFTFGVMRLVNFAYGEYYMLGAYALLFFRTLPLPLMLLLMVAFVIIVALGTERVVFRPLRNANPVTMLIASFALSVLFRQTVMIRSNNNLEALDLSDTLREQFSIGTLRIPKIDALTIAGTIVILAGLALFFRKTVIGIQMRAVAENFRMARLLGVRVNMVIATTFGISGGLSAVVAILIVAKTGMPTPTIGVQILLFGLIAAVIGGARSLAGAALGGFIVGALSVMLEAFLPIDLRLYRDAILCVILVGTMWFRPHGIIPGPGSEERA